jgi:hypothetical protein
MTENCQKRVITCHHVSLEPMPIKRVIRVIPPIDYRNASLPMTRMTRMTRFLHKPPYMRTRSYREKRVIRVMRHAEPPAS